MHKNSQSMGSYGDVAIAPESPSPLARLFLEVEEYFDSGVALPRGAQVVDVGANIGTFAVAAAKRCERELRLICFEPVPQLYRALERNLHENDWLRGGVHRAFNCALSTAAEAGTPHEFYYFRRFPGDSTMDLARKRQEFEALFAAQGARVGQAVSWAGPVARLIERGIAWLPKGPIGRWASDRVTGSERIQVEVKTLASALRKDELQHVDLLKVDVEGAELKVLQGVDSDTWGRIHQVVVETDGAEEPTRALISLVTAQGLDLVRVVSPPSTAVRGLANVIVYLRRPGIAPCVPRR